jgi:hypothetical protein
MRDIDAAVLKSVLYLSHVSSTMCQEAIDHLKYSGSTIPIFYPPKDLSRNTLALTTRADVRTRSATAIALLATLSTRLLVIDKTPNRPAERTTRRQLEVVTIPI